MLLAVELALACPSISVSRSNDSNIERFLLSRSNAFAGGANTLACENAKMHYSPDRSGQTHLFAAGDTANAAFCWPLALLIRSISHARTRSPHANSATQHALHSLFVSQKQGPRLCCPVCKITAHTGCIGILIDKIKFHCKPTFKDVGVRQYREASICFVCSVDILFPPHSWQTSCCFNRVNERKCVWRWQLERRITAPGCRVVTECYLHNVRVHVTSSNSNWRAK